jgi:trehalose-6-phosphate synthase
MIISGWHPNYKPSTSNVAAVQKTAKPPQQQVQAQNTQKIKKPSPAIADQPKAEKVVKSKATTKPTKEVVELTSQLKNVEIAETTDKNDLTIEISKKLKRLRRKLRDSQELDEKIKSGEMSADKVQLEKVSRIPELQQEIEKLEEERLVLRQGKK